MKLGGASQRILSFGRVRVKVGNYVNIQIAQRDYVRHPLSSRDNLRQAVAACNQGKTSGLICRGLIALQRWVAANNGGRRHDAILQA
jgi:hypothetical protein